MPQNKVAALMVGGKVVTGANHGFAFSKLTEAEKDAQDLRSGFLDPLTGKFFDEDGERPAKSMLLVRHAHVEGGHLSNYGRDTALGIGDWLTRSQFRDYAVFSSPSSRCQETSFLLGKPFKVTELLDEVHEEEPLKAVWSRLGRVMADTPHRCIFVTHQDIVRSIATLLQAEDPGLVPHAAMLHFLADQLAWMSCGDQLADAA